MNNATNGKLKGLAERLGSLPIGADLRFFIDELIGVVGEAADLDVHDLRMALARMPVSGDFRKVFLDFLALVAPLDPQGAVPASGIQGFGTLADLVTLAVRGDIRTHLSSAIQRLMSWPEERRYLLDEPGYLTGAGRNQVDPGYHTDYSAKDARINQLEAKKAKSPLLANETTELETLQRDRSNRRNVQARNPDRNYGREAGQGPSLTPEDFSVEDARLNSLVERQSREALTPADVTELATLRNNRDHRPAASHYAGADARLAQLENKGFSGQALSAAENTELDNLRRDRAIRRNQPGI